MALSHENIPLDKMVDIPLLLHQLQPWQKPFLLQRIVVADFLFSLLRFCFVSAGWRLRDVQQTHLKYKNTIIIVDILIPPKIKSVFNFHL